MKNIIKYIPVILIMAVICFFVFFRSTPVYINDTDKLGELMNINLSGAKIVDVKYEEIKRGYIDRNIEAYHYTEVAVFLEDIELYDNDGYIIDIPKAKVSEEDLSGAYYENFLEDLNRAGLKVGQLQGWIVCGYPIKKWFRTESYSVCYYFVDETYDGKTQTVAIAQVPRQIIINVDKILSEQNS